VIKTYLTGFSDEYPDIDLATLATVGTRVEYAPDLDDNPRLYFSPIDKRLHIKGVSSGYLSISDHQSLTYHDTNRDNYADHWRYYENDEVLQDLYTATDHLIHFDAAQETVNLRRIEISLSSFEMTPPRNHDEWQALGQQLESHQRNGTPDDLTAMAAQFDGRALSLRGATLTEYRPTSDGFRFSLDLRPGFRLDADPAFVGLGKSLREPGSYIITYAGSSYTVIERTPPSPYVADLSLASKSGSIKENEWQTIQATIANAGTADQNDLLVCAALEGPAGASLVLTETVALLPGGGQQPVAFSWAPAEKGRWVAQVGFQCGQAPPGPGEDQGMGTAIVDVVGQDQPSWNWFLTLGGRVSAAILPFLVGVALLAGLMALLWTQGWPSTTDDSEA
jgi:hypothetical protein